MTLLKNTSFAIIVSVVGLASVSAKADSSSNGELRQLFDDSARYSPIIDFPQRVGSAGDVVRGRSTFGFLAGSNELDRTNALFTGFSTVAGREITSNGKVCGTCHLP